MSCELWVMSGEPSAISEPQRPSERLRISLLTTHGSQLTTHDSIVEIPQDVEEQRRRVGEAVEAVEDAAMAGQHGAAVLDAEVALDGGDGDIADETRRAEQQA